MKTKTTFKPICYLINLFFIGVIASTSVHAQSTVTGIRVNGQNMNSASVTVFPNGKGNSRNSINVNEELQSGTKLIIPAGVQLALKSKGGSQEVLGTKGKPVEYTVTFSPKGENHSINGAGGKIVNKVVKTGRFNYTNSNSGGSTAAAIHTEFSFTDNSEGESESADIQTNEGTIHITDQVPVYVNGQEVKSKHDVVKKSVLTEQTAGQQLITHENPVYYNSYEEAIQKLSSELNREYDEDGWADNELCIGELYMENNNPAQAIQHFNNAVQYYESAYGSYDLETTIDAKLCLAEALLASGNSEGSNFLNSCIYNLEEQLADARDELAYVRAEGNIDPEFACEEVMDIADLLSYAYLIAGNNEKENFYDALSQNCD